MRSLLNICKSDNIGWVEYFLERYVRLVQHPKKIGAAEKRKADQSLSSVKSDLLELAKLRHIFRVPVLIGSNEHQNFKNIEAILKRIQYSRTPQKIKIEV